MDRRLSWRTELDLVVLLDLIGGQSDLTDRRLFVDANDRDVAAEERLAGVTAQHLRRPTLRDARARAGADGNDDFGALRLLLEDACGDRVGLRVVAVGVLRIGRGEIALRPLRLLARSHAS